MFYGERRDRQWQTRIMKGIWSRKESILLRQSTNERHFPILPVLLRFPASSLLRHLPFSIPALPSGRKKSHKKRELSRKSRREPPPVFPRCPGTEEQKAEREERPTGRFINEYTAICNASLSLYSFEPFQFFFSGVPRC